MTANDSPNGGDRIVSDADLIRYLDGELSNDEQARVADALERESALSDRLHVLRRRSERLSVLLAVAGPSASEIAAASPATLASITPITDAQTARSTIRSVSPMRDEPRFWLRAAIVLLVLGGVFAVPPVRAWVIRNLQRITSSEEAPARSPAVAPVKPALDNFAVNFPVSSPSVTIEVTATQSAGRLLIRLFDVAEASAEIRGNLLEESFLVLPDQNTLRIQNARSSRADYLITLPRSVSEVRVTVGSGPSRSHVFSEQLLELEIPLARQ
jgi:hypothetical protein